MHKKKILFISDVPLATVGGAQNSMQIIAKGLANFFSFCIAYPGNETNGDAGFRHKVMSEFSTLGIHKSLRKLFQIIRAIKKVIHEEEPDLIHVQMPCGMIAISVLAFLKQIPVPVVYTDRGRLEAYSPFARSMIGQLIKRANNIVLLTDDAKRRYLEFAPAYSEKYTVISNTAGEIFERDLSLHSSRKHENGVFRIMFCGRFHDDKNWDLAREIMERMDNEYNCEFIVVLGSDSTDHSIRECETYLSLLRDSIVKSRLETYIDLPLERMVELYAIADIFVLTSKTESFGRTAAEAMSQRCVVFGTNIPGLSEVIGQSDYLYTDAESFILAFQAFTRRDIDEVKSMFYRRYKACYSLNRNLSAYKELYDAIFDEAEDD